jgi:hypothetical protein
MTRSIFIRELSGRSRVDDLASSSLSSQGLWCDIRRGDLRRRTRRGEGRGRGRGRGFVIVQFGSEIRLLQFRSERRC